MSFELEFDEKAIEFLDKLPKELKKRIFDKIIQAKENPFHYFERLAERAEYRLRVGDYRIIADIDSLKIQIRYIGHRKNVYEKY